MNPMISASAGRPLFPEPERLAPSRFVSCLVEKAPGDWTHSETLARLAVAPASAKRPGVRAALRRFGLLRCTAMKVDFKVHPVFEGWSFHLLTLFSAIILAPSTNSISSGSLGLSGTGGVGNAYYVLLGTTNLSAPSASWTPLLTNQFDNSGNFTTNLNTSAPQTFYRLQLQ
jgi:hypothetical protein